MSDNNKQINKIKARKEKQYQPNDTAKKVDSKMWREACVDGKKAKDLLLNMRMPNGAKFVKAHLENGSEIDVKDVSLEQALRWANELCPDWAWKGFRR